MIDAAKKTADGIGETVIIDHTEINTVQAMIINDQCRNLMLLNICKERLRKEVFLMYFNHAQVTSNNLPYDSVFCRLRRMRPQTSQIANSRKNVERFSHTRLF